MYNHAKVAQPTKLCEQNRPLKEKLSLAIQRMPSRQKMPTTNKNIIDSYNFHNYSWFSLDISGTMLVPGPINKETMVTLVSRTNPQEIEFYSHANFVFFFVLFFG